MNSADQFGINVVQQDGFAQPKLLLFRVFSHVSENICIAHTL